MEGFLPNLGTSHYLVGGGGGGLVGFWGGRKFIFLFIGGGHKFIFCFIGGVISSNYGIFQRNRCYILKKNPAMRDYQILFKNK